MPSSRGHEPVRPADLSAWEQATFPALRRIRDRAQSTPVDDELPDEPWNHLAEFRAAVKRIGE